MILNSVNIERNKYSFTHNGLAPYSTGGTIEFEGGVGSIRVVLKPEQCKAILAACADAIISASKEAAESLMRETIESLAQIEGPKE